MEIWVDRVNGIALNRLIQYDICRIDVLEKRVIRPIVKYGITTYYAVRFPKQRQHSRRGNARRGTATWIVVAMRECILISRCRRLTLH